MIGGKGGLNFKDYPFAFSIAALLFPQILQIEDSVAPIFAITLVGGMLGSLLTITNPIGLIIREIYLRSKQQDVYPKLYQQNLLVKQILKKNFHAALSSPSISYEQDKMVGMIYFLTVLILAIFRTTQSDFVTALSLDSVELWGIRIGLGIGFVSVLIVLHYNIRGFIIRKLKKNISHFDRIQTVTISNLATDFANLSNEGKRWGAYVTNEVRLIQIVLKEFVRIYKNRHPRMAKEPLGKLIDINMINQKFKTHGHHHTLDTHLDLIYSAYSSAWEISVRYDINLTQALTWFVQPHYLNPVEFDEPISQLQTSIESRDWYNATLKTYRITDRLEEFLKTKGILTLKSI